MPAILSHTFERWDGKGLPAGRSGVEIPVEMRIAQLADTAEVFLRTSGLAAAVGTVKERRGTQFDPRLADLFCAHAVELTAGLLELDPWPEALSAAPDEAPLSGAGIDTILSAMGDFADLKSPFTAGHSRAVAELAAGAAGSADCQATRWPCSGARDGLTTWAGWASPTESGTKVRPCLPWTLSDCRCTRT